MHHRIVTILLIIVLASLGSFWGLSQPAAGQDIDASPLDLLVGELIYPRISYEEYTRVSDELAAQAADAVAPLTKRLDSADIIGQLRILGTLSRIGPESEPAVPQLLLLLRDIDPSIRAASARCLGALGEAGQAFLPDLFASLDDPDEVTVAWAARAVDALEPDYVKTRLDDLLRRAGTSPEDVRLLPLRTWYRIARRNASDPALAEDLRQWTRVVHFTSRDRMPVAAALDLPPRRAG
jgi:hypothetical protein